MADGKDDTLALVRAVKRGRAMLVERLIAAGAAVNGRIHDGRSPLFVAAERGDLVMIRLLIASGADVNLGRESGFTPLFAAAISRHASAVQALLTAGANPLFGPGGRAVSSVLLAKGRNTAIRRILTEAEDHWRGDSR